MIFKTMPSSIDKSRTALSLFNKDWNIFRTNWQNASGGLKNKFATIFNSNDIKSTVDLFRKNTCAVK